MVVPSPYLAFEEVPELDGTDFRFTNSHLFNRRPNLDAPPNPAYVIAGRMGDSFEPSPCTSADSTGTTVHHTIDPLEILKRAVSALEISTETKDDKDWTCHHPDDGMVFDAAPMQKRMGPFDVIQMMYWYPKRPEVVEVPMKRPPVMRTVVGKRGEVVTNGGFVVMLGFGAEAGVGNQPAGREKQVELAGQDVVREGKAGWEGPNRDRIRSVKSGTAEFAVDSEHRPKRRRVF